MKRLTDRRTMLLAAGTAAVAAVAVTGSIAGAGAGAAQPVDISGTIALADGTAIPKGQIDIYLEDTAAPDNARGQPAMASVASDGGSKAIAFTLTPPASFSGAPTQQIVAQLAREDGWLLARGSAQPLDGEPVDIVLFTVMY